MDLHRNDIISHRTACEVALGTHLTKGMNFRIKGQRTVILTSFREGAPYGDRLEDDGVTLVYEGHDVPRSAEVRDPKRLDQPMHTPTGRLTENGKFYEAAQAFVRGEAPAEPVIVFEKIKKGIWAYGGIFSLVDAWTEHLENRTVFKFLLVLDESATSPSREASAPSEHNRLIPTDVKLEVFNRDHGRCVKCGSRDMLHFDHILPYSKGGSSVSAANIQLLCARHNLEKRDRIE